MEHTTKETAAKTDHTHAHTTAAKATTETKHRSRTSSKASRSLTRIDRQVSKAVRRVTRALDSGVETYMDRRDKSKAARRDGVLVDFVENVSHGISRAVSEASPVINDVAGALNTRAFRSGIRRAVRNIPAIPFVS